MALSDTVDAQRANRRLIRESMNAPLLTRQHELDLARRWRYDNDERALHELIQSYMRLVISTASRFKNYGLPLSDLVQEGVVGLMQAAARFEPERDVRFSTYAAWWIRSAMQDFILRNWSVVRTGTTAAQKSLFFNLRRLRAKIDDGRYASLDEAGKAYIAQELSVDVGEVEAMEMRLMGGDQSLNATITPSGEDAWQDFLADERPSPEEIVTGAHDGKQRSRWLALSLAELSERERTIIHERRLREDGRTLEELGVRLGHQQGARAPDRAPRAAEAEGGPAQAGPATRSRSTCSPPCRPDPPRWTGRTFREAHARRMTQPESVDVLVVGGGHAGLLLGAALAAHGRSACAWSSASPRRPSRRPRPTGGPWRCSPAASRSSAGSALGRPWRPCAEPIERVEVTDVDGGGRVRYDGASPRRGSVRLRHRARRALRRGLLAAFLDQAGSAALRPRRGRRAAARRRAMEAHARRRVRARSRAPLVVGADGRGSRVRELARIARRPLALRPAGADDGPAPPPAASAHGARVAAARRPAGDPAPAAASAPASPGWSATDRRTRAGRAAARRAAGGLRARDRRRARAGRRSRAAPSSYPLGAQHARSYVAPRRGPGRRRRARRAPDPRPGLQHGRRRRRRAGRRAARRPGRAASTSAPARRCCPTPAPGGPTTPSGCG